MEYIREGEKGRVVSKRKKEYMYKFSFLYGNLIKSVNIVLEQHDFIYHLDIITDVQIEFKCRILLHFHLTQASQQYCGKGVSIIFFYFKSKERVPKRWKRCTFPIISAKYSKKKKTLAVIHITQT